MTYFSFKYAGLGFFLFKLKVFFQEEKANLDLLDHNLREL